ncbi:MAG: hypothetical protein ACKN9E_12055 [Microcystaceae cyanobacterium]
MRNLLTVTALLISVTGIVVSLAREELRCQLGLQSAECAGRVEREQPSAATAQEATPERVTTRGNRNPAQMLIEKLPTAEQVRNVITPDSPEATQGQKAIQKPTEPKALPPVGEETQPIAPPAQEKITPEPSQETAKTPSETISETPGQSSVEPSTQPSAPAIAPDGQPIPVIPPENQSSQ